jgi:hypothetical protein
MPTEYNMYNILLHAKWPEMVAHFPPVCDNEQGKAEVIISVSSPLQRPGNALPDPQQFALSPVPARGCLLLPRACSQDLITAVCSYFVSNHISQEHCHSTASHAWR